MSATPQHCILIKCEYYKEEEEEELGEEAATHYLDKILINSLINNSKICLFKFIRALLAVSWDKYCYN